jgi:1-acyl-sn-glycerol-3-phosphate acyltransferase/ribosomal protein S27AE
MDSMQKEGVSIRKSLLKRKSRRPNYWVYQILVRLVVKRVLMRKLGVRFIYRTDIRTAKGPFVIVSNHASRLDYIYVSTAFLPHPLNYVVGYNEFFRDHLKFIFKLMRVIPKKNFVADFHAIKSMRGVFEDGGALVVFPEGMSSISGANQPAAVASGKFLKQFGAPVYRVLIQGGYMTSPKFNLKDRPGRVDVTVDYLFHPDELKAMSGDEIQMRLDEAIMQDDYAWNKTVCAEYDGHGEMASGLHTLLYYCPRCGKEFAMRGEGDRIFCTACGNGATLDGGYNLLPFDADCVIPQTPRHWYDLQREHVRTWVGTPGWRLEEWVKIGVLPDDHWLTNQSTSTIVGEGRLCLDASGLHFSGTKDGDLFAFDIPPQKLPTYGMCTDVSRFYTFASGEFIEFYPEGETVAKWFLATEESHRLQGGTWKDFPDAYYTARDATYESGEDVARLP